MRICSCQLINNTVDAVFTEASHKFVPKVVHTCLRFILPYTNNIIEVSPLSLIELFCN